MAEKAKVKVISMVDGRCGIDSNDLHISRRWPNRGSTVLFDRDVFNELIYDPAFSNMIKEGMLYVDDLDILKENGLEEQDATEPSIKLLDEKELNRLWNLAPLTTFKADIKKLTKAQITSLADYAISAGKGDTEKAEYLKQISGKDILKGQQLLRQSKEA